MTPAEWVDSKVVEIAQGGAVDHWEAYKLNISENPIPRTNLWWGDSLSVLIHMTNIAGFFPVTLPVLVQWNWEGTNDLSIVNFNFYSASNWNSDNWNKVFSIPATNALLYTQLYTGTNMAGVFTTTLDWGGTIRFWKATASTNDVESAFSNMIFKIGQPKSLQLNPSKP